MSESGQTLLVEIRTEELPPLLLGGLAKSFPDLLLEQLRKAGFANDNSRRAQNDGIDKQLATPRRLAALLENILAESPPEDIVRHGPQLAACYDSAGAPTKALSGFMRSVGATSKDDLHQAEEKGKTFIAWRGQKPARLLSAELASLVENTLLAMRAPRLMRWGDNDFRFIRPVRGVLLLHGNTFIDGKIMGVVAGRTIKGHPVMHGGDIEINNAEGYESVLYEGHVIVNIGKRWERISQPMPAEAFISYEFLLHEVMAMCEYPVVIKRQIDEEFMTLPKECIFECMTKQQRAFCVSDGDHLSRDYYIVADNMPESQELMCRGYDAVLRARLRDVQFYYEEDIKLPLSVYVEKLKGIVFHNKIGTQYERIERICKISDAFLRDRDGQYSKADFRDAVCKHLAPLSSLMVGEYPGLQKSMADIYFQEEGEQYKDMRFIEICFDMEKIVGMFGVGEKPSGNKDPHGLRRCAQNIIFGCWYYLPQYPDKKDVDPDIRAVIAAAVESFGGKVADVHEEVYDFILDRVKFVLSLEIPDPGFLPTPNYSTNIQNSVLSRKPNSLSEIFNKIAAVGRFAEMPEAAVLSAADKRIKNIFRKSSVNADDFAAPDESLFQQDEERTLWQDVKYVQGKNSEISKSVSGVDKFFETFIPLVAIASTVDVFFNKVLVNVEDEKIRNNRFALLAHLSKLLNEVADISCLVK